MRAAMIAAWYGGLVVIDRNRFWQDNNVGCDFSFFFLLLSCLFVLRPF